MNSEKSILAPIAQSHATLGGAVARSSAQEGAAPEVEAEAVVEAKDEGLATVAGSAAAAFPAAGAGATIVVAAVQTRGAAAAPTAEIAEGAEATAEAEAEGEDIAEVRAPSIGRGQGPGRVGGIVRGPAVRARAAGGGSSTG